MTEGVELRPNLADLGPVRVPDQRAGVRAGDENPGACPEHLSGRMFEGDGSGMSKLGEIGHGEAALSGACDEQPPEVAAGKLAAAA